MAALTSDESQLALRAGVLHAPRLARSAPVEDAAAHDSPDPSPALNFAHGTVLITGGTGMLGSLLAEHMVQRYGARHLLLCSRTGQAGETQMRLEAAGASVKVVACDVSQRDQVEALLASIAPDQPLTAVIHAAGTLDDGVLSAQNPQRIDHVFRPKLDAAWHLHELTRELELQAFVLFSSAAGVLGGPGQSNYAAANAFLDSLAHHRNALGLPGLSLAWGYWGQTSAMASHLQQVDLDRMARGGVRPLSSSDGLALMDRALAGSLAHWVPIRFDHRLFSAPADQLPPLMRGLGRRRLRTVAASASAVASFKARLATLGATEREAVLLEAVISAVSTVMAVPAAKLDPDRPLSELGLDSLMAVELRNQLAALSGLRLPPTLLFDHPTPAALVKVLNQKLSGVAKPQVLNADKAILEAVRSLSLGRLREAGLLDVLLRLANERSDSSAPEADGPSELERIDSMSVEELVQLVSSDEDRRGEHAG